jgi:hypothetical protein
MKTKIAAAVVLALAVVGVAHADPVAITQMSAGATDYAFFIIKTKKLRGTYAQGVQDLANALAPYGVTPCVVSTDVNGTIACGTPGTPTFMLPVPNEFFTYDLAFNFKDLPPINDRKGLNKDSAYNQVYAVNFLQPVGTIPGDLQGRNPVRVQFGAPVTEFSFLADGGQAISPASRQIQFTVNGIALAPQDLTPGTPIRLGVQDPLGFTEVTINALGGDTNAFIASEFAFVPMQ